MSDLDLAYLAGIVDADGRPYLRIKAGQADLALQLAEHLEEATQPDAFGWAPAGWDHRPTSRALYYDDCVALNEPRNRRSA